MAIEVVDVQIKDVAGELSTAELAGHCLQFLAGFVAVAALLESQGPARGQGTAAGEGGETLQHRGKRGSGEDVQVELRRFGGQRGGRAIRLPQVPGLSHGTVPEPGSRAAVAQRNGEGNGHIKRLQSRMNGRGVPEHVDVPEFPHQATPIEWTGAFPQAQQAFPVDEVQLNPGSCVLEGGCRAGGDRQSAPVADIPRASLQGDLDAALKGDERGRGLGDVHGSQRRGQTPGDDRGRSPGRKRTSGAGAQTEDSALEGGDLELSAPLGKAQGTPIGRIHLPGNRGLRAEAGGGASGFRHVARPAYAPARGRQRPGEARSAPSTLHRFHPSTAGIRFTVAPRPAGTLRFPNANRRGSTTHGT